MPLLVVTASGLHLPSFVIIARSRGLGPCRLTLEARQQAWQARNGESGSTKAFSFLSDLMVAHRCGRRGGVTCRGRTGGTSAPALKPEPDEAADPHQDVEGVNRALGLRLRLRQIGVGGELGRHFAYAAEQGLKSDGSAIAVAMFERALLTWSG